MTRSEYNTLFLALLEIKMNGPVDRCFGICYGLDKLGAPSYERLEHIFRAWPECDPREKNEHEECVNPIPRKEGVGLWDDPLRHELLDFMIEYCEKELTK